MDILSGKGEFMARNSKHVNSHHDTVRMELVVREGLLFAWELGFQRIIVEVDSKLAFERITGSVEDRSHNGVILRDTHARAHTHMLYWFQ